MLLVIPYLHKQAAGNGQRGEPCESACGICRSKNGKANALLYDQVTTALDRTVFTNVITDEPYRANDKWEVFCGSLQSVMKSSACMPQSPFPFAAVYSAMDS